MLQNTRRVAQLVGRSQTQQLVHLGQGPCRLYHENVSIVYMSAAALDALLRSSQPL